MNILLGYASAISREFAQLHLGRNYADLHITTAGSFDDCLELVKDFQTLDFVGLDLEMPDMEGIRGFKKMRKAIGQKVPVAVMGPVTKGHEAQELLMAGAAVGEFVVPADMLKAKGRMTRSNMLTKREREVLSGLLAGKRNREIALQLGLSEVTIKHHLKGLRSKLGAKNRTHAVCRAIALGIT
jgi:DNA-binding NarL/FixJ family response regulator